MSHLRAHRLLSIAMQRLERGDKKTTILHAIKGAVEDLQDPFAGEIDDFLKERDGGADTPTGNEDPNEELREDESRVDQDAPQEEAEDKLNEETPVSDDMPGDTPQDAPQEEAEDKYDEEQEDTDDEKVDELQQRKQDIQKEIDKVQKQSEEYAESALRKIAVLAKNRGFTGLANKFYKVTAGGIIEIINNLLMKEYLQRDIAINYYYLFDESHSEYLKNHFESEKGRMVHLQKTIVELGASPTLRRLSIPPVNPLNSEGVMGVITELERQAVAEYLAAAKSLEGMAEYTTLKVWLEKVATEEADDTAEMDKLVQGE
jgi:hypothetical protein